MDKQNYALTTTKIDRKFAIGIFRWLKFVHTSPLAHFTKIGEKWSVLKGKRNVILGYRQISFETFCVMHVAWIIPKTYVFVPVCMCVFGRAEKEDQIFLQGKTDRKQKSKAKRRNDCNVTSI